MHFCEICNYLTSSYCNLKKHYNTQKHINLIKNNNASNAPNIMIPYTNPTIISIQNTNQITNDECTLDNNSLLYFCFNCNKEYEYKIHTDRNLNNKKDLFYKDIMRCEDDYSTNELINEYLKGFFWTIDYYFNKNNINITVKTMLDYCEYDTIHKILTDSYNVNFSYIEKNIKYMYDEINDLNK